MNNVAAAAWTPVAAPARIISVIRSSTGAVYVEFEDGTEWTTTASELRFYMAIQRNGERLRAMRAARGAS